MSRARRIGDPDKAQPRLFDLKGALECVIPNLSFRPGQFPDFALAVDICSADERIGFGGQFVASKSSAPGPVFVAEMNADLFLDRGASAKKFRELDRYPAITRDIAMIVPEKLTHAEILRGIEEPRNRCLKAWSCSIFLKETKEQLRLPENRWHIH